MPPPEFVYRWRGPLQPATIAAEAFGVTGAKGRRLLELLRVVVRIRALESSAAFRRALLRDQVRG